MPCLNCLIQHNDACAVLPEVHISVLFHFVLRPFMHVFVYFVCRYNFEMMRWFSRMVFETRFPKIFLFSNISHPNNKLVRNYVITDKLCKTEGKIFCAFILFFLVVVAIVVLFSLIDIASSMKTILCYY